MTSIIFSCLHIPDFRVHPSIPHIIDMIFPPFVKGHEAAPFRLSLIEDIDCYIYMSTYLLWLTLLAPRRQICELPYN